MKIVGVGNGREIETPETYGEALRMLTAVMNAYHDRRGGSLERASVAGRVAYGLFGQRFMAADPTNALVYLLQEICRRRGAGLDGLEKLRRWRSADEEEKRT
jgi:hypothetical protein